MSESALKPLCVPENFIRSTVFSDVYRSRINLDGRTQDVDIEHFQIPLDDARVQFIQKQYNIAPGEFRKLNADLAYSIKNAITYLRRLTNDSNYVGQDGKIPNTTLRYLYQEITKDPNSGRADIYLVTPPLDRYLDNQGEITSDPGIVKLNFFGISRIMYNLFNVLIRINKTGSHIGVLDMEAVCFYEPEQIGTNGVVEKGSKCIIPTNFMFAHYDNEGLSPRYLKIMPPNTHRTLKEGKAPTEQTDIYTWAYLYLTLLNGTYGTEESDPDITIEDLYPAEVCEELQPLVDMLYDAVDMKIDAASVKSVVKKFNGVIKRKDKSNAPDFDIYVHIKSNDFTTKEEEPAALESMQQETVQPQQKAAPAQEQTQATASVSVPAPEQNPAYAPTAGEQPPANTNTITQDLTEQNNPFTSRDEEPEDAVQSSAQGTEAKGWDDTDDELTFGDDDLVFSDDDSGDLMFFDFDDEEEKDTRRGKKKKKKKK